MLEVASAAVAVSGAVMRGADRRRHVLSLGAFVFVEATAGSQGVHAEQPCQQSEHEQRPPPPDRRSRRVLLRARHRAHPR